MEKVNNKILKLIDDNVMPGMNYGIVYDKKYFGSLGNKAVYPKKEKNEINTIYDLASITKVLVCVTIILKLVEEEKISLNDNVRKYIPDYKHNDVTIKNLLTHNSGLQSKFYDVHSREELINQLLNSKRIYPVGEKVIYSDLNYILLGLIIEKIYNKQLDEIAKKEVFIPLDMKDTSYNPKDIERCAPTEKLNSGLLRGTVHDWKARMLGGVAGHAGVFSTVEDMTHYIEMILNKGVYNNKQFLNEKSVDMLFKKIVFEKKRNGYRSFCYFIDKNRDIISKKYITKDNSAILFNGYTGPVIVIDRKNKLGIMLLANRVHPKKCKNYVRRRHQIIDKIYKELLEN